MCVESDGVCGYIVGGVYVYAAIATDMCVRRPYGQWHIDV